MNNNIIADGVPEYKIIFSQESAGNACLVIPVINEGNRIHSLLAKINNVKKRLNYNLDVIIVDGGSTDGSLEESTLRQLQVSVHLLKIGSGRLSSQLRCAYHYALENSYSQILTIDGNDKDDPSTIPAILEKLNQGYAFVQASRFISGGQAINTPWMRTVAIRLIHAPLLSIASSFHWTDTTQGFRGYSSEILKDSRVDIFREVFSGYELLAYLSYIVPKLGYKCIEVPSRRIYPQGAVPTKISSVRGNANVLGVLFKTIFGCYNP